MKYEYHSLFIDDEVLILILQVDSGRVSRKKVAVLLDFLSPFHKCIFGQYKESISSKMPII